MPEYCWNAGISKDICEARTGVVPDTFSIDLLSETEFLVYKLPKTGRGMSDHESMRFVDLTGGSYLWGSIPADVLSHSRLRNKQEEIKQRPGNIIIRSQ